MTSTSADEDAIKFADKVIDLHNSLAQARASYADVEKKTGANNFYTVQWGTFEKGPIDTAEVLKHLKADIKNKEFALVAAKTGLEEALDRMHVGEHVLWWYQCERKHSSVEPLAKYQPVVEIAIDDAELPVEEQEGEEEEKEEGEEEVEKDEEVEEIASKD